MQEDNVFIIEENREQSRPPGNGNNCHGHHTSIANGGRGHWQGDSCGCDGTTPSANIGMYVPYFLVLVSFLIYYLVVKNNKNGSGDII